MSPFLAPIPNVGRLQYVLIINNFKINCNLCTTGGDKQHCFTSHGCVFYSQHNLNVKFPKLLLAPQAGLSSLVLGKAPISICRSNGNARKGRQHGRELMESEKEMKIEGENNQTWREALRFSAGFLCSAGKRALSIITVCMCGSLCALVHMRWSNGSVCTVKWLRSLNQSMTCLRRWKHSWHVTFPGKAGNAAFHPAVRLSEGRFERDIRRGRGNDVRGMKMKEIQKGSLRNVWD